MLPVVLAQRGNFRNYMVWLPVFLWEKNANIGPLHQSLAVQPCFRYAPASPRSQRLAIRSDIKMNVSSRRSLIARQSSDDIPDH